MTKKKLLVALPLAFAVQTLAAQASPAQDAFNLCMAFNMADEKSCQCMGEAWDDNLPGQVDPNFLEVYARTYEATGGDRVKTDLVVGEELGLTPNAMATRSASLLGRIAQAAQNCRS